MLSPQTPSRRSPLLNQSSFTSLGGLEKSVPPTPSSAESFGIVAPDDLNRPLPPLPIVPRKASSICPIAPRRASSISAIARRRASSIYSVQHEDIIDYYSNSNPYDEHISPLGLAPPTVGSTLRNLYGRDGSVASPAGYPEQLSPDFYRPDTKGRGRPEWTLENPKTHLSITRHDLPSPSLRSDSPNAVSRFTSIDLTADAAAGNRPASPQVRSALGTAVSERNSQDSGLRVPSPGFRRDSGSSSLRPVSPKTLKSSPRKIPGPILPRTGQHFLFPEPLSAYGSTVSSMRSVSPLSQPAPSHPRRQKQLPPPPINVRRKDSDISATLPDPATVHYSHEHNYPDGPLAPRISYIEDYALGPASLHSSKLLTPTTFQSHDLRPTPPSTGHTSPASFAHPPSLTDPVSCPDGPTSPKWPHDAFFDSQSPTERSPHQDIYLRELSPRFSHPSRASHPNSPRPSYSPSPRPSHPSPHPSHPPPTPSEARRILTAFSDKYPSTAPPPPSTRLRSYASSTRASLSTRLSDIYDTLSSLSPSSHKTSPAFPSPLSPGPLGTIAEKPASPVSPFTPLTPAAPAHVGPVPREIHRSPAIPVAPYQYLGAKAFEAAEPSPKGKARKKAGSPRRMGRIASLLGRGRGRERARVELKKKIVVLGVGGGGGGT